MPQASSNSSGGGILVEEGSPRSTISLTSPRMTSVLSGGGGGGGMVNRDGTPIDPTTSKGSGSPILAEQDPAATDVGSMDAVTPTIEKDIISAGGGGTNKASSSANAAVATKGAGVTRGLSSNGLMQMTNNTSRDSVVTTPMTPLTHSIDYSYASYPNVTPRSGYYGAYSMTPEPASPATHPSVYDVTSFLQQHQHGGFHPGSSSFLAGGNGGSNNNNNNSTALSPTRNHMLPTSLAHGGMIPPPSPLFPRINSTTDSGGVPPPVLPYMSPQLSAAANATSAAYSQGYAAAANDEAWNAAAAAAAANDRNQQNGYPSPHANNFNFPPRRAARSYSIEQDSSTMLPPAVLQDVVDPAYSPYGGSQTSAYSMQIPPWPYGGPPDPYSLTPAASPLQPRPVYRGIHYNAAPPNVAVAPQYHLNAYAAQAAAAAANNSPGPPIQTTSCNKGPDGANLFIFHIPNNFTNIDMYHLFQPFGNLLSVRIMIEKETGRSRGFGFVSYDSPESAALAIKELNGYSIGNKRLKVQHKQIRRQDLADREQDSFGSVADAAAYAAQGNMNNNNARYNNSSLPPSGPNAANSAAVPPSMWYDTVAAAAHQDVVATSAAAAGVAAVIDDEEEGALGNLGSISDALPDISNNNSNNHAAVTVVDE